MVPRQVRAPNPGPFTLDGTRSWLLGRREAAVIDPGPDVDSHVRALVVSLEDAERVEILVTHAHPDHAGAAPGLALALGRRARIRGVAPGALPLAEGDTVTTDEGELRVVETPGHARPHLAFLHPASRTLFCGDLLLGRGDTTWVGEYPEAVTDYLASLRRVAALGLRLILPAHGPPLDDPDDAVRRFLEHRTARIAQVQAALRGNPSGDPDRLVAEIYGPELPPRLREAARLGVRAILAHLGVATGGVWGTEPSE